MDFRKHLKHPWARQNTHVPWNPLGENVTGKCGDRTWERKTKVLQLARSLEIPTAFEHIYTHFALGKLYAAGSSMQKTTCRWPSPRIPPAAAGAESHLEAEPPGSARTPRRLPPTQPTPWLRAGRSLLALPGRSLSSVLNLLEAARNLVLETGPHKSGDSAESPTHFAKNKNRG